MARAFTAEDGCASFCCVNKLIMSGVHTSSLLAFAVVVAAAADAIGFDFGIFGLGLDAA